MPSVVQRERDLYENVWATVGQYGDHAPGEIHVPLFKAMSGAKPGSSVLDAGCGSGKGAVALVAAGFDVRMLDLTNEGLVEQAMSIPFTERCLWSSQTYEFESEYVYCCDVLEHIPTEYTMLTIARLLGMSIHGLFLSISLVPDQFGIWVGKPLHQTVREFGWWRDRLRDLGELVEARDLMTSGAFFVRGQ